MNPTVVERRMRRVCSRVVAGGAALIVALGLTSSRAGLAARGAQQADDHGIAPSAMAQIESLIREKETRSPAERKTDSQLLYARRMELGIPIAPGVQTLEVDIPYDAGGHAIVDVTVKSLTPNLLAQLAGLSREVKETGPANVQMHVALAQVDQIAAEPDVIFVQPKQRAFTSRAGSRPPGEQSIPRAARREAALNSLGSALAARSSQGQIDDPARVELPALRVDIPPQDSQVGTGVGSVSSQADVTHRAAIFRGLTGANGTGVRIGVLSDGVAHLADAQASGDLGAVTVLPGQAGPANADEGTAMLELIHDMAPGAQLYFATAVTSITSFAQNIRDLRAAGCDIIVDDVGYYVESPFQDGQGGSIVSTTNGGVVTQAVKDVANAGALYFSAAGNSGNLNDGTSGVWEGDFVAGAPSGAPFPTVGIFHRFTGTNDFNTLTLAGLGPINLFWSDALGASGNDYDLFRLNTAGTAVGASSTNIQNGDDDPYEQMSNNTSNPRIVIVKKASASARFLHLNTNRGRLSVATAGQTHGHAATSNPFTFDVAATSAVPVFPNPHSVANLVETFSSDGPRRIFYDGNGASFTPGNLSSGGGLLLQKPDLTAADGVFVTGAGEFPGQFFGTSAAAPNAAAIMALIKSANPGFDRSQLRSALFASAIDIEAPGVDRDSGVGIVMAAQPQPGCTFTSATGIFAVTGGGSTPVSVTASAPICTWVAFSNVPWIILTNNVGVGDGTYTLTILRNFGPPRSGTLVVGPGFAATLSQGGAAALPFHQDATLVAPDLFTVESNLTVAGLTQPITNVSVSLYMTHAFDSDITFSLVAPDGTVVRLSTKNGGGGDDYGSACTPATARTTFDDGAENYVTHGAAPFVGSYRPEQPLARFKGKSGAAANGTWKLRINDSFAGDVGTLQCWSLNINQGFATGVVNDFNGNGSSDVGVFRPSSGRWFINGVGSPFFGLPGDIPVPGNYDGNGLADVAVFRPATGEWFIRDGVPGAIQFGRSGDVPVPADYDGDTKTDIAVFRTTDSNVGVWYFNIPGQSPVAWGVRGDVPMPGDYDGDGRADVAVYRPATGQWFVAFAATGYSTSDVASWGLPGDIPVRADLDNDRKLDLVVFRPSTGTWFMAPSASSGSSLAFGLPGDIPLSLDTNGDGFAELCVWRPATGTWFIHNRLSLTTTSVQFGLNGDIPLGVRPTAPNLPVSDFDAEGVSDITVFRPSSGTWFTRFSSSGFATTTAQQFGLSGDTPVNGDYDGDRRSDVAVYRPSSGQWFIMQSATGTLRTANWGLPGDTPMPADYDGDGRTDVAIYRPSAGQWFLTFSSGGGGVVDWGLSGDTPFATDFDGDGRADLAVYRPSTNQWFLKLSTATFGGGTIVRTWGLPGDVPLVADFDGDGRSEITVFRPSTGEWFGIDPITTAFVLNRQWGLNGDIPAAHDFDGDGISDTAVFRPSIGQWFIRRSTNGTLLNLSWGLSGDIPR